MVPKPLNTRTRKHTYVYFTKDFCLMFKFGEKGTTQHQNRLILLWNMSI